MRRSDLCFKSVVKAALTISIGFDLFYKNEFLIFCDVASDSI